jgi:hypothetical protein
MMEEGYSSFEWLGTGLVPPHGAFSCRYTHDLIVIPDIFVWQTCPTRALCLEEDTA